MTTPISTSKQNVVEAIVEAMDYFRHESIGFTRAFADGDGTGAVLIQTWPDGESEPPIEFLARVTRIRNLEA